MMTSKPCPCRACACAIDGCSATATSTRFYTTLAGNATLQFCEHHISQHDGALSEEQE